MGEVIKFNFYFQFCILRHQSIRVYACYTTKKNYFIEIDNLTKTEKLIPIPFTFISSPIVVIDS